MSRFDLYSLTLLLALTVNPFVASAEDVHSGENLRLVTGKKLYLDHCASCHGDEGQGVAGEYDETLYGNKSLDELSRIIHKTMPIDDPELVVDDDSRAVAEYLYETFYTAEARARNTPPRIDLVRMTNVQFRNVVADVMASFLGRGRPSDDRGLSAQYFDSRSMRRDKRKIERIDPVIDFDFQEGSPGEEIGNEEFSMQWNGSIIAAETGDYEFCVKTENGFRLWVNETSHALIDGWVASGGELTEHRQKLFLIGGRAYPVKLDYFKYKDKTASVELRWTPPGGVDSVIPQRVLVPNRVPETLVVDVPFPPDDASFGYERGSSISKAWSQGVTQASVQIAHFVVDRIDRLAGTKRDDEKREQKIRNFCLRFVEQAFRRPLTEEQKQLFVETQLQQAESLEEGVKRVVILTVHAPQFLYPELNDGVVDAYDVASRLSFGMWDSIPDQSLLQAAAKGELLQVKEIRTHAERMLRDDRTRFKIHGFFHEFLPFHEAQELSKDSEVFPGFDRQIVADLKTSLELFIDDIVWSQTSDYRELLLSSDLYLNQRLAEYYDHELSTGEEFQRVSLNPEQRAGVVTHPFLLSTLAYQEVSSPIHRGVFLTRKILNRSLKPPPMAIEFKDSKFDPTLTMREKVTELTKSKACMNCHSTINPLGFSLENYDAVGRFRTIEKEKPIDTSSEFIGRDGEVYKWSGPRDVAEFTIRDEIAQRGFIEHLFHHETKQGARAYGEQTLETLRNQFVKSEFNMQKLIIEINTVAALHGVAEKKGN